MLIDFVFSTPKFSLTNLPPNLISNESKTGQKFLAESKFSADYPTLQANFVSQSRRAFCGVASSVIALNSLRSYLPTVTQTTIFNDKTRKLIHPLQVTFGGMTLAQLNNILQAHQLKTKLVYANDIELRQFRLLAQKNLTNPHDLILVNYQRQALNQNGGGHFSPLAAYHQDSDRFLILDVATDKYPPVWVRTEELWQGMNTYDPVSNLSRGFIIVES